MTDEYTLPAWDDCIDLYLTVSDEIGERPFVASELPDDASVEQADRLLDLSVAYGLLEMEGDEYQIAVPPDAPERRWTATFLTRVDRIRRSIGHARGESTAVDDRPKAIRQDDHVYASIFVPAPEDEAFVRESIRHTSLAGTDGVVLRTPAANASALQRIADEICSSDPPDDAIEQPGFEKETTDVVGAEKDALEFRLFLLATQP